MLSYAPAGNMCSWHAHAQQVIEPLRPAAAQASAHRLIFCIITASVLHAEGIIWCSSFLKIALERQLQGIFTDYYKRYRLPGGGASNKQSCSLLISQYVVLPYLSPGKRSRRHVEPGVTGQRI